MNRIAFLLRLRPGGAQLDPNLCPAVPREARAHGRSIILELDEMWHYVKKKRAETLDLEGLRSGHGATAGLGMWGAVIRQP